jgi:hypothetical protein
MVCGKCSRNRTKLPQYGIVERVRVCDDCFRNYTVPARQKAVQLCEEMGFDYVQIKKSMRALENANANVFDVNSIIEGIAMLPAPSVTPITTNAPARNQRADVGSGNRQDRDSDSEERAAVSAAAAEQASAAAASAASSAAASSAAASSAAASTSPTTPVVASVVASVAPAESILPPSTQPNVAASAPPAVVDVSIARSVSVGGAAGQPLAPPDADICKICFDAPYECVILECGHICSCMECSKLFLKGECPICRVKVTRVVKFFKV